MKILFLTQWFAPEPHFKGLPFATELRRRGHEVTVVTGFPNYPGGKLYPGYRVRLVQSETIDGVKVIRVPLYPSHDVNALGRVLNYSSYAAAAAVATTLIQRHDVAYVYHPPATVGLPALVSRWLHGTPCVYDVQDLWPDTLEATGMLTSRTLLRLVSWWSNFIYTHVDHVVVLSPGFKRRLIDRGVAPNRICVISNWSPDISDTGKSVELPSEECRVFEGRFNVLFAGNMGPAQALSSVLNTAEILQRRCPAAQFVFVGGGVSLDSLKRRAAELRLVNVAFLPRRPAAAMSELYRRSDALLVHLRDDPLFEITVPSKTQTYLRAGRPIIMAVRGDAADIVRSANAGVCCVPEDPESLCDAVVALASMSAADRSVMGANGRNCYQRQFDFEGRVGEFERLLSAISANASSRSPII